MNAIQEERPEEVRQLLGKEMDPTAKNFMVLRACADQFWVEIAEMIYNWTEPYLFGDPSKLALRGHDTKRQKLYAKQISNQRRRNRFALRLPSP
jgi:hypothetical protein